MTSQKSCKAVRETKIGAAQFCSIRTEALSGMVFMLAQKLSCTIV